MLRPAHRNGGLFFIALVLLLPLAACSGTSIKSASDHRSTTQPDFGLAIHATGRAKGIPDAFFGFNGASVIQTINIDLLLDPKLQKQLATFPTQLIRVPSGTAAQWIDWRTGTFVDDPSSPFASIGSDRRPVTMDDWAKLIRTTKATPVWDLNVLTSSLDDQIAMLHAAEKLGMPVRYVELGNELWDARSIYPTVYPSGAAYAETMNTWIPALREHFTDIQIAVSGADPTDEFFSNVFGERYRRWNGEVLATIHGADAIAIHPYWTLPGRAEPGSDVAATLTAGLDAWRSFSAGTLAEISPDMDVWLTEWNQAAWTSDSGTQIWAQALSVVAVALNQLTNSSVTMSLVHNVVDGVRNPQDVGISTTFPAFADGADGSKPLARTALGHALPLLFSAVPPGSQVRALDLPDAPRIGAHQSVVGVAITGEEPGAVFVNLGAKPVDVRLPDGMSGKWEVTAVSAPAAAQPGWVAADKTTTTRTTTRHTARLPAYSVVRVAQT